jgi:hypothetical protein
MDFAIVPEAKRAMALLRKPVAPPRDLALDSRPLTSPKFAALRRLRRAPIRRADLGEQ